MANSFNLRSHITQMAMESIEAHMGMIRFADMQYKKEFKADGAKHGYTINIRKPMIGTIRTGDALAPQSYYDEFVPCTVSLQGTDIEFTTTDLKMAVDDEPGFKRNVLDPLMSKLINKIDADGMALYSQIPNYTGTPGTALSSFDSFVDASALITEAGAPRGVDMRAALISPTDAAGVLKGIKTQFNPNADLSEKYRMGNLGVTNYGMQWEEDFNVPSHTIGTFGTSTPLMKGTTATAATQIVTDGWAIGASALKVGDIVSIAGVYDVNPLTKTALQNLKQFTVTEAASDTSGEMTIKISPAIYSSASGAKQNVSALPANDAAVYVFGKNDNTHQAKTNRHNLVFARQAIAYCNVDLPLLDPAKMTRARGKNSGLAIRMWEDTDIYSNRKVWRLDILGGWALLRPEWACRVVSA